MLESLHTIQPNRKDFSRRLVVKFNDNGLIVGNSGKKKNAFLNDCNTSCGKLLKQFPGLEINKLFRSLSGKKMLELMASARHSDPAYHGPDLSSYYCIACPEETDPNELLETILKLEEIELAYIEGRTEISSTHNTIDQVILTQGYLNPAPQGINAQYAWKMNGGKGLEKVQFIDIEQGWNLCEGLDHIQTLPLTGTSKEAFRDHGAAVLSIIMKKENTAGNQGITPGATGYIISAWRPDGSPNNADAVLAAVSYLNFGDIILLEGQSYHSGSKNKLWPVEIQDACFAVIRLATALGIIVIEAGGNGNPDTGEGNDLDLFTLNGKRIFYPPCGDGKDSGAILVAAATLDSLHSRIRYSNYGSRIDCFAWGEGVASFGNYSTSPASESKSYINKLNGTSCAAAIIAGAAIAVQSILEAAHKGRLGPVQMRNILSSDAYGTASANGRIKDKMGVMPDLKKIIDNFLPVYRR